LEQASEHQIAIWANAINPPSALLALDAAETCPFIAAGFGIHPSQALAYQGKTLDYEQLYKDCQYVGEIGLDRIWSPKDSFAAQMDVFADQLHLAEKYSKPIMVHTGKAEEPVLLALEKCCPPRVLIHWYAGDYATLRKLLQMGCYFTVAANVAFSPQARDICRAIPLDRLLCETDGANAVSWALDRPQHPADSSPQIIAWIYDQAAQVRNMPLQDFAQQVNDNARRFLTLS